MVEIELKIPNPLGLHARAAAQLVRLSAKFSSKIILKRTDNLVEADAKSILSVLTLAASKGVVLIVSADGSDEAEALLALSELVNSGFGEL
jgi:phosphotransferase system HPr (HPr) family protein